MTPAERRKARKLKKQQEAQGIATETTSEPKETGGISNAERQENKVKYYNDMIFKTLIALNQYVFEASKKAGIDYDTLTPDITQQYVDAFKAEIE